MSFWPLELPAPLRTVSITPGRKSVAAEFASGRRIVRNWGGKQPDEVTVQLRITATQEITFSAFYSSVGLDGVWFTADWLTTLGYADHKARFIGYPKRKGVTKSIMDFSITFLVQSASLCIDNDTWPTAGTGGSYSESSSGGSS